MDQGSAGDLARAVGTARARLVPFLVLMFTLAYLDRTNIGLAEQAFRADTGVSDAGFAFGAGLFFVGYAFLEVPSNLILRRVGARAWLARIMVSWGAVAAATVFARGDWSFWFARFMLGVAEAGFFPGVILYLGSWFSARSAGGSAAAHKVFSLAELRVAAPQFHFLELKLLHRHTSSQLCLLLKG